MTVPFTTHGLKNTMCLKFIRVLAHLISPTLVGVKSTAIRTIRSNYQRLFESNRDCFISWAFRNFKADNLIVKQVKIRIDIAGAGPPGSARWPGPDCPAGPAPLPGCCG